jgi:hypothetical protein
VSLHVLEIVDRDTALVHPDLIDRVHLLRNHGAPLFGRCDVERDDFAALGVAIGLEIDRRADIADRRVRRVALVEQRANRRIDLRLLWIAEVGDVETILRLGAAIHKHE